MPNQDEEIARHFERQLLGSGRTAFPCGCVLECYVHYPFKDWAYTGFAVHTCQEHPSQRVPARISFDNGASYAAGPPIFVGKFGSKPAPTDGALEHRWLKTDGTQVLLAELEAAMEEALDRLDAEEEARVEKHNATRYCYEGIIGTYRSKELLPARASRIDPHVASQEGWHAIGRYGSVAPIPRRSSYDGIPWPVQYSPGAFIPLRQLQKEHTNHKLSNFDMLYGLKRSKLNRVSRTIQSAVPNSMILAAQLQQIRSTLDSLKDSKGFEPGKPHTLEMTPRQIKTRMAAVYPDWEAKPSWDHLKEMELGPPEPSPAPSPDPSHDTLPLPLSKEELEEEREKTLKE